VAQRLRDAGASVTVLSRHPWETAEGIRYTAGDLSTGEGIEGAVRGAEVIVHCAGGRKGDEQKTRTLVSAAKDARHIVLISVVGADRIPQVSAIDRAFFGYFGMKLATERVVEQSGISWTTLRATQIPRPDLDGGQGARKTPGGPCPNRLSVPAGRRYRGRRADGRAGARRAVRPCPRPGRPENLHPGRAGQKLPQRGRQAAAASPRAHSRPGRRALRAGANLAPDRADGKRTWEEFLADRI
jgi:uncharacterized protein YbjT (DUF2867 family)